MFYNTSKNKVLKKELKNAWKEDELKDGFLCIWVAFRYWYHTGCSIKNGHQRKWYYTLAGGINQKSVVTTYFPYIYRYWNKKQWLHLVAFIFSYGLQLIRSKSTDFTNLTCLRYLQAFSSNHWNTWYKNILTSDRGCF